MTYELRETEIRCMSQLSPTEWRRPARYGHGGPNARLCFDLCRIGMVEGARLKDGTRAGVSIYRLTPEGVAHLEATKCEA
jgi:hypothetical protein